MTTISSTTSSTASSSSSSGSTTSFTSSATSSNGTISFSGVSSGMDTATMVEQLVEVERAAEDQRISNETTAANADLAAFESVSESLTSLQTALDTLSDAAAGGARAVTIDEDAGFTATAAEGTATGSYEIEVSQLAQSHKLTSAAYDSEASVGSGTLTISAGEHTIDVEVDEDDTLSSIADKINDAAGNEGVIASVLHSDDGVHLVLTASDSGTDNALTITSTDSSLAALTWPAASGTSQTGMTETTAAQDAVIKVDGHTSTSASNSIDDVIDGVALDLTEANAGTSYTLKISSDNSNIESALSDFVTAYNSTLETLNTVSQVETETDTESESESGSEAQSALAGDSLIRSLEDQLRSAMGDNVVALDGLGITMDKTGTMTLDSSVLTSALREDPDAVSELFSSSSSSSSSSNSASSGNLTSTLNTLLDSMMDKNTGLIPARQENLEEKLEKLEQDSADLDTRMAKVQATYEAQFTAMEKTLSEMETTSTYLDQYLNTDDDED